MNAIPNNMTLPEKCRKKAYEKLVQLAEHFTGNYSTLGSEIKK